jgi:hypothetical protein
MFKLVATSEVPLSGFLLVSRSEDEELRYRVPIDDFDVELLLIPAEGAGKYKKAQEKHYTFGISTIEISVSRDEEEEPPSIRTTPKGRDLSERSRYFDSRYPSYQAVALTALNRLIRFFKYTLRNPGLHELDEHHRDLQNPTWTNEAGEPMVSGIVRVVATVVPGSADPCVKPLTPADDANLQRALEEEFVPELHEKLLSTAQEAIFAGDILRAVLGMAIACEVAVKSAFFGSVTAAGSAFEHLEDKGHVRVSVIELIHGAAREAFGQSFKDVDQADHENIDYLFRCRNKVAHRGAAMFRDYQGELHRADRTMIWKWWASVGKLMSWLDQYRS